MTAAAVLICSPATVTFRRVTHCPTCDTRRRFVGTAAVWYSTFWTCCTCGDSWDSEEGRMPRQFARGWREKEAARARRKWNAAPNRDEARRMLADLLAKEVGL